MHSDLTTKVLRTVPAALLAVLAGLALIVGAGGTASAAEAPARPAVAVLSPQQATEFTRQVEAAALQPMFHPSCAVDYACGVMLSPSETQSLWKAVVNQPLQKVRKYCEGLFGGVLKPFCAQAAQFLGNLSAPNGRCLFVGLAPAPNGSRIVVTYTKVDCY